jgi:hypothetical protein
MRRRGALDSLGAVVGDLTGALRRRREGRERRVRLYDERGHARTVDVEGEEAAPLLEAATAMIDAVDAGGREGQEAGPEDRR